jgi:peroxiredoxin
MVETPSQMVPLGTQAPGFTLEDHNPRTDRGEVSLEDVRGENGTLVVFLCQHCPYVKHLEAELGELADELRGQRVGVVGVVANDLDEYPQDGPDGIADQAERAKLDFPYLIDDTQEVAQAYGAACTPDFFLFDGDLELFYRGQFDDTRPNAGTPTGEALRRAADALLEGVDPPEEQTPSQGCNIKWKAGNEPA